ncbi:hypothetical protein [Mycoplasma leonicaptivi]|uniref:hypothetical protein n=1 Tax=Mycoplasma leonicaptivi TaxID=36742 RepID=UPI000486EB84|nr:hypothetical protein [Mycoplasma leonicaptivi]
MKLSEKYSILVWFDKLAHDQKIVYSLFSTTIQSNHINTNFNYFEVVIKLSDFLKINSLEDIKIEREADFSNDNPLPFIRKEDQKIYLNLLIESTFKQSKSSKINNMLKKINLRKTTEIYPLLNNLVSFAPDVWSLIYFDKKECSLKIETLTNLNPNYYEVLELSDDLKFPYIKQFKNY